MDNCRQKYAPLQQQLDWTSFFKFQDLLFFVEPLKTGNLKKIQKSRFLAKKHCVKQKKVEKNWNRGEDELGANFVFSVFLDPESDINHLFVFKMKIFFDKIFDPQKSIFQKKSIFEQKFFWIGVKKNFFSLKLSNTDLGPKRTLEVQY